MTQLPESRPDFRENLLPAFAESSQLNRKKNPKTTPPLPQQQSPCMLNFYRKFRFPPTGGPAGLGLCLSEKTLPSPRDRGWTEAISSVTFTVPGRRPRAERTFIDRNKPCFCSQPSPEKPRDKTAAPQSLKWAEPPPWPTGTVTEHGTVPARGAKSDHTWEMLNFSEDPTRWVNFAALKSMEICWFTPAEVLTHCVLKIQKCVFLVNLLIIQLSGSFIFYIWQCHSTELSLK